MQSCYRKLKGLTVYAVMLQKVKGLSVYAVMLQKVKGLIMYAVILRKVNRTNCVCSHVTESKQD